VADRSGGADYSQSYGTHLVNARYGIFWTHVNSLFAERAGTLRFDFSHFAHVMRKSCATSSSSERRIRLNTEIEPT